ncbi:MAG TPA: hypothetical protein VER17_12090 [Tepidisphaeraceae bacterium]|nr:hypothetical protein [Tepidisphaeraceae bacterium]
MANSPADLPDPLDRSDDLSLDNTNPDDLISQLAGEEIARLLAPDANWQPAEVPHAPAATSSSSSAALKPSPRRDAETPVEELAAQLDQLFEEIRQGKPVDPPPPRESPFDNPLPEPQPLFELAEPVLVMRRRPDDIEESVRDEPRQTLIAPLEEDPLPPVLRSLAWLNAPVIDAGVKVRMGVSVLSLVAFAGSLSALAYVLVLRQQNG